MLVKDINDLDFINYKKPSMFIAAHSCTFKCDKEYGKPVCQNSELAKAPNIEISISNIIKRFNNNPMSEAIVWGGLEPFDDFDNVYDFLVEFRKTNSEDVVIYTGYNSMEIREKLVKLSKFKNVIVKLGRFIPNQKSHFDSILGVELVSDNQVAIKLDDVYK